MQAGYWAAVDCQFPAGRVRMAAGTFCWSHATWMDPSPPECIVPVGRAASGWVRDRQFVLFAEHFAVRDVTRTGYLHLAYGHHVCAEGDVAFDVEPVAAAQ